MSMRSPLSSPHPLTPPCFRNVPVPSLLLHPGGPVCSRLVFGAWRLVEWDLPTHGLLDLLHTAVELGITTVDHADIYGDYTVEERFGAALSEEPGLRDRLQLVTKCGIKLVSANRPAHTVKHYDTSRAHLVASVERSLRRLRTDRLDLFLIHRPDPFMDADETAGALSDLVASGKVLHVGVSNFTLSQFDLLASRLDVPLVTNQIEASVLHLDAFLDGTLDQCQRLGVAPMAWSPLGGGALFRSESPQAQRLRDTLGQIGGRLGGATVDQVALAWLLAHPARIVPVLGTGKADHLHAAAGAVRLALSREEWFRVWSASTGADVP